MLAMGIRFVELTTHAASVYRHGEQESQGCLAIAIFSSRRVGC